MAGVGAGAMLVNGCAPNLVAPTQVPSATGLPAATSTPIDLPTATSALTTTSRKLCFVLWDHQLARYNYRPRNLKMPLPETCPLRSGATNRLTPEWEAYWRGILHLCNPNMSADKFEPAWQSLVVSDRAFTNGSGPDTGKFGLHSITCGGATHEMVTGVPEGRYMQIYTLDIHQSPPPIPARPVDIDMTRHFFATSGSNVRLPDGSYAVYGFPQFENCIVPLVSPSDTDSIEVSRIKVVPSIQRPYNP